MRQSALWSSLFFVGLLFACGRFIDFPRAPASSTHPTLPAVVLHRVKVAVDGFDWRVEARERAFAMVRNAAPALTP